MKANAWQLTHSGRWNVGFKTADCVHKQTCLKQALPVNRRLSLEPGHGLLANWWPSQPWPRSDTTFRFPGGSPRVWSAGPGAWVSPPAPPSSGHLFPVPLRPLGPGGGAAKSGRTTALTASPGAPLAAALGPSATAGQAGVCLCSKRSHCSLTPPCLQNSEAIPYVQ